MRITGALLLSVAAALSGLVGVLMLGASGLTLAGPGITVIPYSDSDDSERAIGLAMGALGLGIWIIGLIGAALVGLRGSRSGRGRRVIVGITLAIAAAVVLAGLVAVLSVAAPASEYPQPEWGRA
ncbi:hypothetical protein [Microbacterium sp. 1P10AE]|uniref:hypothetical protein n=1 Tax=Microbacterium sp. 1P10AE TaxID=3132286 RepID=UPI00399F9CEC